MATYAIGDVQGCAITLDRLLERIRFKAKRDVLWFTGDLVNRGPASLDVLRRVMGLGSAAVTVLGNHDLHLLGVASGAVTSRGKDTLNEVLAAPDRRELLTWLGSRPLLHAENGWTMVHAGLPPEWSVGDAALRAGEVQDALAGPAVATFLGKLREPGPEVWDDSLTGLPRLRYIVGALTRLRTCRPDGRLCLDYKSGPKQAPKGCIPWFDIPARKSAGSPIICGHWAALGLHLTDDVLALDSGCVWGGSLTALRLEDRKVYTEKLADRVDG